MTKRAAAYYRMSSDSQEASIPAQREAVHRWAADNGWQIVAEYQDDGISGDDTARRAGFRRLLGDATSGRWSAILCWDLSRFGRFDSLEGGYWLFPLRQAGVTLITLDRGPVDWADFGGRIVWAVEQEGKNAYLKALSRDVLRGKAKGAAAGRWQGGRIPIGYLLDGDRFVVDPARAPVVRRMFSEYLAGRSLRDIALGLNSEGIRSPRGGVWSSTTVQLVLTNRWYLGEFRWNRRNVGPYSHLSGGAVRSKARKSAGGINPSGDWITVADHHPPLVDAATFDRVAALLRENRIRTTPRAGGGGFLFTGLVRCGHCGSPMGSHNAHGSVYLVCQGYARFGRQRCERHSVREDLLLGLVVDGILREIAGDAVREAFRGEARRAAIDSRGRAAEIIAEAKAKRDAAAAEIARLERRLCEVDAEFLPVVQKGLRAAQAARDAAEREMDGVAVLDPREIDRQVDAAERVLADLQGAIARASAPSARALLRQIVGRIEVRTELKPWGKRLISELTGARMYFAPELLQLFSATGRSGQVELIRRDPAG